MSDSWKAPLLVAPSPKKATATRGWLPQLERERRPDHGRQAAADHRVRAEVAALDVVEVHRAAVAVRRALDLAVQLGHHLVRAASRWPARGRARDGSSRSRRRLRARRRRRPRRPPGRCRRGGSRRRSPARKRSLDLLLEAADQQHLAEERDQLLTRKAARRHRCCSRSRSTRSTRRQL